MFVCVWWYILWVMIQSLLFTVCPCQKSEKHQNRMKNARSLTFDF